MNFNQVALANGWRSGLEEKIAASLEARGADFSYESLKITWVPSAKPRTYTPDFVIKTKTGKVIIVESKGRWVTQDRMKMKAVIEQHPDLDIRFVFQNPNQRISKGSKTTYAVWCQEKLGSRWAKQDVPSEWLNE
jgi:hypothetical protein